MRIAHTYSMHCPVVVREGENPSKFPCPVQLEREKITYLGVRTIRVSDILERIRYIQFYIIIIIVFPIRLLL